MASFDVVFSGDQSFRATISGDESFGALMDTVVEVMPEAYAGNLDIYPSEESIILETARKSMPGNVVVNPIPDNYCRWSWDGSVLKVY